MSYVLCLSVKSFIYKSTVLGGGSAVEINKNCVFTENQYNIKY